jgi:hypothetical protein
MSAASRYSLPMAQILDVRTRKLSDDVVEAVAITDKEEPDGSAVVVRGLGPTPEAAIADAKKKAEAV